MAITPSISLIDPAHATKDRQALPVDERPGRSELGKDEMRAAQFTPESEGAGIDHAPDARATPADAAPNEGGRVQRQSR